MWEYVKKVIEYAIFSFLVEGVIVVAKLSCDGLFDAVGEVLKIAAFVAPAVLAGMAVLSLIKIQRRRKRGRYEKEPISIGVLVALAIVIVAVVAGVALGANLLANYLYHL